MSLRDFFARREVAEAAAKEAPERSAGSAPEPAGAATGAEPDWESVEVLPRPRECPFCGGGREVFFYTVHGWWQCRRCHPPVSGEEIEPPAPLPEGPGGAKDVFDEAHRLLDALYRRLSEELPPGLRSWARACRPDLLAAIDAADAALDQALARLEEAGDPACLDAVRRAAEALEAAWRRAFEAWPVERVKVGPRNAVYLLKPKAGVSEADRRVFEAWLKSELRIPAELRWVGGAEAQVQRDQKGQLILFPGIKQEEAPRQQRFRSPWQDWLENVEIIRVPDLAGWRAALEEARAAGICGVDMETTMLPESSTAKKKRKADPLLNRIRLIQIAVPVYPPRAKRLVAEDGRAPEPGGGARAYVLDFFALSEEGRREALEALAELAADKAVAKVGHNLKFDLAFLRAALGRRLVVERVFDTMLASQLCVAGDFVPGGQWEKWCEERGLAPAKNDRGQGLKATRVDIHGHVVEFEYDNQKEIKPFYPTHSLQQVAHRHLEVWLPKEYQASDWRGELSMEQIRYAALDAAIPLPVYEVLRQLLIRNRLTKVARLEFACVPAVVEVELAGMYLDAPRAREFLQASQEEAARLREELAALARDAAFRPGPRKSKGKKIVNIEFNPDSSNDALECLRLLAEREGVLAGEKTLAVSGEEFDLETKDDTLSRLAARLPEGSALRRFAEALRSYRAAKKRADFLKQWLESLHPTDDRLHPDLRQINPQGVGRFSASNPNLQQAPRGSDIRALFKAPDGRKLVVADYSAIEMRIMAQISGDVIMRQAFLNGVDIHKFTAARMAGKNPEEITKEERQAAKAFNFGLIYGMQAATLQEYAETSYGVNLTIEEAEAAREAFFRAYPAIAAWHRRQDRRGYQDGFEEFWRHDFERGFYKERRPCVRTLAGRLRVWPTVERERQNGEGSYLRKAGSFTELYNTPDQGTGADLIKIAMVLLYRELLRRGWEDVRLIATVHDELVLETPESLAEEAAAVLKEAMLEAGRRLLKDVPVEVEVAAADSWADK